MIFFTLMSAHADGRKQGQACRTQLLNYFPTALPHRVVCVSARERDKGGRDKGERERECAHEKERERKRERGERECASSGVRVCVLRRLHFSRDILDR
jgi:hypothetical protein